MREPSITGSRRSIRRKGYDYSQAGAYFVTICSNRRREVFGNIRDGTMLLNSAGDMVQGIWNEIPELCRGAEVDYFVVMPNHVHGIVMLGNEDVGAGPRACPCLLDSAMNGQARGPAPTVSLPGVVQRFKSLTTAKYRSNGELYGRDSRPRRLWQRNYYEHIIRDDDSLNRIREYIFTNPLRWGLDCENPNRDGIDEFDLWLREFRRHRRQNVLKAGK